MRLLSVASLAQLYCPSLYTSDNKVASAEQPNQNLSNYSAASHYQEFAQHNNLHRRAYFNVLLDF
jgi:hypothetical protein